MYAVMLDSIADAIIADATHTVPHYAVVTTVAYVFDEETGEPMVVVRTLDGKDVLAHMLDMSAIDETGRVFPACARAEFVGEDG